MKVNGERKRILLGLVLSLASLFSVLLSESAYADQIINRSLTLESNAAALTPPTKPTASAPSIAGHADNTGKANHHYKFTIVTTAGIRSVGFQYCTTPTGSCTAPTDLTAASATLAAGSTGLGSSPSATGAVSAPYVSFGSDPSATLDLTLNTVYNPSASNTSFYVRITTYTSSNATTGSTDAGVVAASTAQAILVTGYMPEYLLFCTGGTITGVNCASATSGAISFNQDFDAASTAYSKSQMTAATNASSGYAIVATGTTLTSGTNFIPQIGTTATSASGSVGFSKFGINVVVNTGVATSAAINPASNGTTLRALPQAAYATNGSYALDLSGATAIAKSDDSTPGTPAPTLAQTYTVTYMANVSGIQAPGAYTATINYVCTPTF